MVWMIMEALARAALGVVVGLILKGLWRVVVVTKACMIPGCRGLASRRGLCLSCYSRAKKKVDTGEVTWDKLVERELCEDASDNPFDDAYARAMEDE